MWKPKVKIYGERNTGTNYVYRLIDQNLMVDLLPGVVSPSVKKLAGYSPMTQLVKDIYFRLTFTSNLGWKHSLPLDPAYLRKKISAGDVLFITITKNPYSWLLSLFKRPYHHVPRPSTLEELVTKPWQTVGRENSQKCYDNPIDMWNKKNTAYIRLNEEFSTVNLKYEDLLANPIDFLSRTSETYDIESKFMEFKNIEKASKKQDSDKDFGYYQEYYLQEKWREKLNKSAIEAINQSLDMNLMRYFRYEELD